MFMGMQTGLTKYCYWCLVCLRDSRATTEHHKKCKWVLRSTYIPGTSSVQSTPLVNPKKTFMSPFHVKLALMKYFVKAMAKVNSKVFQYLFKVLLKVRAPKLRKGIFLGHKSERY